MCSQDVAGKGLRGNAPRGAEVGLVLEQAGEDAGPTEAERLTQGRGEVEPRRQRAGAPGLEQVALIAKY